MSIKIIADYTSSIPPKDTTIYDMPYCDKQIRIAHVKCKQLKFV